MDMMGSVWDIHGFGLNGVLYYYFTSISISISLAFGG